MSEAKIKKLRFFLSLTTQDNDYQTQQAVAAEQAAERCGVELQITFAQNDPIEQTTQILRAVQEEPQLRPDAVLFEPVGATALPQVARAAVSERIAWVVLNRDANYIQDLRKASPVPVFVVSSDHAEIGRIQGRQMARLLPAGGSVLYIQGPSENSAAKGRAAGMHETKPENIQLIILRAQWTQDSALKSVGSWLKLPSSQRATIDLIAAQNDVMALGARAAFQELSSEDERERWLNLPFIGCDGLPLTGQAWLRNGHLIATIIVPTNAGEAIEMLADALQNQKQPPERVLTIPVSIPPLDALIRKRPYSARL